MKNEGFKGIIAGLEDAIAFVKGDTAKGRIAAGPDVKAIRAKTKLSQANSRPSYASRSPRCAIGNSIGVHRTLRRA